ncbi:helix-turn-helix domain-containing protein [Brevibacillus sp. TJ4]|uniref:helix-turn-helix domain-containing protein n=1 Tax=Brevibacillus sp. TJ4 TaxID=3234853 RepID=UPI0037D5A720
MSLGSRIREIRKLRNLTQKEIASELEMGRSNFGHIENDRVIPSSDDLQKIADILHTTTDYLLGRTDDPTIPGSSETHVSALTSKEERDIVKDLERIMADLESNHALAFHGDPIDEEEIELLRSSLENSLRIAKMVAKKKFTPKKYRK